MSAIPLTKEELLSLKVGDKVISSYEIGRDKFVGRYYEIVAIHEGNKVSAIRRVNTNGITGYSRFSPRTLYDTGEIIDKWFKME